LLVDAVSASRQKAAAMRRMSDTIARLKAAQARFAVAGAAPHSSRLSPLTEFGSNPGALRGFQYLPQGLARAAPLVVVLHGCTQTAAGYDHGAGWSRLSDQLGFAVLYPEQQRANNPNCCFNWFVPGDIGRGFGEALSIAQMVRRMVDLHGLDRDRVFVTGLSAGGAMAAAMLAAYPEMFAAGAVIAGLPYGCAASIPDAFDRMRGHGMPPDMRLEAHVRHASNHRGPWPRLSIWHGSADRTVSPSNMEALIGQWRGLHGLKAAEPERSAIGPHSRRVWRDGAGTARIEALTIAGMGHGTPIDGSDAISAPAPYSLDAGISSTRHIAQFWQLGAESGQTATAQVSAAPQDEARPVRDPGAGSPQGQGPGSGVGKVIEDALRAAGLMR